MSLKLRRGTNTERLATTPEVGELVYTTDTKQLYVGDLTGTPGGTLVSYNGSLEGELGGDLILNENNIIGTGNINITGTISSSGNITTQGNVIVQGNITLGSTDQESPNNDSLVINAEINSNLSPRTTDTFDIGSQTKRWETVYANNVFADLEGNVKAQDSTILVDSVAGVLRGTLEGLVSNPGNTAVQGDVIGNLSGNVIGSIVSGDGLVLVVENGTDGTDAVFRGTFIGDLQGTVENGVLTTEFYSNPSWIGTLNGNKIFGIVGTPENPVLVDGDVQGSVIAQDSTLLVDGVTGVLRGVHIGELQGSVFTGGLNITNNNIVTTVTNQDLILSTQGTGKVNVPGTIEVGRLTVGNDTVTGGIDINYSTNAAQPLLVYGAYDSASSSSGSGASLIFGRARGTPVAPTTLTASDEISTMVFSGFHGAGGTGFGDAANIAAKVVSVSGTTVEGKIEFRTTSVAGGTTTKFAINHDGSFDVTDTSLVAGVGTGDVDTSAPVKFVKVFIGSTAYAMPLYAIN